MNQQLLFKQEAVEGKQDILEANRGTIAKKKAQALKDNEAIEAQITTFSQEANALIAKIQGLQDNSAVYSGGALAWPVPGIKRITSQFGYRIHPITKKNSFHHGIDIGAPSGSKVVAAADGNVIFSGYNRSYGNYVMIDHGSGIVTVYAHNTTLLVVKGNKVTRGQQIASSGSTGVSSGAHVHFEVRVDGMYKNPKEYL